MAGKLYLVATPIGNLEDITLRAIRVLKEADIIAAEDTRHTLQLLNHLQITKPLISYYKQTEKEKADYLLDKIEEGKKIALVSDAGTPGISDPGETIVKRAIERNITIIPIPGACAFITALIASGLSTSEFCFLGFLSVNITEKRKKLEENKEETKTLIFYEAPHKLKKTLEMMKEVLGNRKIVLARELTKIHEEYKNGTISEILEQMEEPKGEYVILVEGAKQNKEEMEKEKRNQLSLEEHYRYYEKQKMEKKEIIKLVAKERGVPKNEIYQYFLNK